MSNQTQVLQRENSELREKIQYLKSQSLNSNKIDSEIEKFVRESEKNVEAMSTQVQQKSDQHKTEVHKLTVQYESLLKKQIGLLTENKDLSAQKQSQDSLFNESVENLTKQYEQKIKDFQKKVKGNVKKIQALGSNNVIKRLLKSELFKQSMLAKGIKLETLQKQSQLEDVSAEVQAKEQEIAEAQLQSKSLDEELNKMRELIETMKELLQNMVKEKQNIVKQNIILKQKMKQSEALIAKLLGAAAEGEGEGEQQEQYEEDFQEEDNEDEEKQ